MSYIMLDECLTFYVTHIFHTLNLCMLPESLKNVYKHCKTYSETGNLLSTDYENGRTRKRPLYLLHEQNESNQKKKAKLSDKTNICDMASPPIAPTTQQMQIFNSTPPPSSSQLAPSSLSKSPASPLIASSSLFFRSSASIRTRFSSPQHTPNLKNNIIERSDEPISNILMRCKFY